MREIKGSNHKQYLAIDFRATTFSRNAYRSQPTIPKANDERKKENNIKKILEKKKNIKKEPAKMKVSLQNVRDVKYPECYLYLSICKYADMPINLNLISISSSGTYMYKVVRGGGTQPKTIPDLLALRTSHFHGSFI